MPEAWASTAEAEGRKGYLLEILLEEKAFIPHPGNELVLARAEEGAVSQGEVPSGHMLRSVRKVTMNA